MRRCLLDLLSAARVDCRAHWRSLGNGERESTELSSAGHADPPGQLRLVAGALVANLETLRTVGPPSVAAHISLGTGEAVVRGAARLGAPSSFPCRRSILGGALRSRERGCCHDDGDDCIGM